MDYVNMKEFSIMILVITGVLPIFLNYALHCVLGLNEMCFINFHSTFHNVLASFLFFYILFSYGLQYPNMSFAVPFSHTCLLVLWSQSLPLLWGMNPLSPLANDGQLKAHSQGSNQIYSPLIGLEEARGRAFISVSSFLFLSSCLRFGLLAGVACGGLSDGQKEELSAELGVFKPSQRRTEPPVCRRDMAAALWWVTMFCLQAEDLSTDWLNESKLSTADTKSGKQKGRAKSETSLSSFPHCQRIHSPVPRVQCQTKHVTPCFSSANSRTKNRQEHQLEQKSCIRADVE